MELRRPVKERARRAATIVNEMVTGDPEFAFRCWVAIRLSDGGSDKVKYDSREDAVRHQLHENQCAYLQIPIGGITAVEMDSYLNTTEWFYDNGPKLGVKLSDPAARLVGIRNKLRQARRDLGI